MGDPCIQEARVRTLEIALDAISESLGELRDTAKQTYKVLADISKQGAELNALSTRVDRCERLLDQIEIRLRGLDTKLADYSSFMQQYEQAARERSAIRNPIIVGLVVAMVLGFGTFMLKIVAEHQYTRPPEVTTGTGK